MTSITNTDYALWLPTYTQPGPSQPTGKTPPTETDTVSISSAGQKLAASEENNSMNRQDIAGLKADNHSVEPVQYRNIGGIKIAVSGHDYDATALGHFSNNSQLNNHDFNDWLKNNPDKTVGNGSLEAETVVIDKENRWEAPQSASWNAQFILDGSVSIEQQVADKADTFANLMQATKQLQQEYGSDIKLARDPNTESYLMLKPGDDFYESVQTPDEALNDFRSYLAQSGQSSSIIEQIFNKHGITL